MSKDVTSFEILSGVELEYNKTTNYILSRI